MSQDQERIAELERELRGARRRITDIENAAEEAGTADHSALIILREDANGRAASATTALYKVQLERDTAIRERDAARDAVKLLRGALEALRQVTIPPQDISGRRMYDGAVEALAATASIPTEQEPPA